MLKNTLCALCLLCFLSPAARAAEVVDKVVAVVNDEIILLSELNQLAVPTFREGDIDTPDGKRKFEAHQRKVLDQMVEKQLIQQQAKELKVTVTEEEVRRAIEEVKKNNGLDDQQFTDALKQQGFGMDAYRKQLKQQLLELKVVNQAVRSRVSISDDEVRAYYAQTARQATGDELQVHLRQIMILLPPAASEADVEGRRKLALQVVEQARGGGDFEALARKFGQDAASKSGGDLGWLARGDLPNELREVVSSMEASDVRGPVKTDRGFHIIQLVEKKEGGVRPFDEVKEQVRRQLYEQQVDKGVQSWIKELRRKAHVEVRLQQ